MIGRDSSAGAQARPAQFRPGGQGRGWVGARPRRAAGRSGAALTRLPDRYLAGLALLFNVPFVLFQLQQSAYDTYTHLFLADHYRRDWWSLWEPRWYLGFSVASYPPLVHQLIALISWPLEAVARFFAFRPERVPGGYAWASEEAAFVLMMLAALALLPVAVRALARCFVGPRAAGVAGLLAAVTPAVSLAAWSFGQLPTLLATSLVLLALARGVDFVQTGQRSRLAQAVALAAAAGAAHHGVFLLVPFAGAALAWRSLATPGGRWRWEHLARRAARLALWAFLAGLAVAAMLWPFLAWSRGQTLQTPIDHASRHNLLADPVAAWFFFWPMYGPLLLALPAAAWVGLRSPRRRPLLVLAGLLFTLGLGGTTALPARLFGAGWAWLTYDRFALWAALAVLPLAGAAAVGAWRRWRRAGPGLVLGGLALLAAASYAAGWHAVLARAQPPAIELAPLVEFLSQPGQQPYRYLTLGFGDQMAKLAALTRNGTPDGNYHTARQLPELRTSGLGALDGAVWNPHRPVAVRRYLEQPLRYGIGWVFVNHPDYLPLLRRTGWQFRYHVGSVTAWTHPEAQPRVLRAPAWARGPASAWWGSAPLAGLALAAAALALPGRRQATLSRAALAAGLGRARQAAWGLSAVLLVLWWHHLLWRGQAPGVFFLYQSVAVFASDLAIAATLGLWLAERWLLGARAAPVRWGPAAVWLSGAALLAAVALSVPLSIGERVPVGVLTHLALLATWYVLCVNAPPPAAAVGRLLAALLAAQALVAVGQAVAQENGWLRALNLPWPPDVEAATPGASVVQNAAAERWLRAYGTLPHPNVLAGYLIWLLAGVAERAAATARRRWLALLAAGGGALVLTFSRASWLAAGGIVLAVLAWSRRAAPDTGRRLRRAAAAGLAGAALASLPLLPWLLVRAEVGADAPSTERRSVDERVQLFGAGLALATQRPWVGVGAGQFVTALQRAGLDGGVLEPVHNVVLLAAAETGLWGGAAALALGAAIGWTVWRRRRLAGSAEMIWGLAMAGMVVIGLLDHYWWTLPPARAVFVTAAGLWAGTAQPAASGGRDEAVLAEVALDARREALGRLEAHPDVVGVDDRV